MVCFFFVMNFSIWFDLENVCKVKGGYFVLLNMLEEYYYVEVICGVGILDGCWIGGQEVKVWF